MIDLTARQTAVLDYIKGYLQRKPYPPTIREVAANFSISPKGAYDHLKALEKKGRIRMSDSGSRTIEVLDKDSSLEEEQTISIPLLGVVAAGKPLTAEENYEGSLRLPIQLVGNKKCFALKVKGDSMKNAGILSGDVAVIEQQHSANNGEIVVAMLEDSVTLKRFYLEKDRVRLQPENDSYKPIFSQDVKILGKLRTILRTY